MQLCDSGVAVNLDQLTELNFCAGMQTDIGQCVEATGLSLFLKVARTHAAARAADAGWADAHAGHLAC
jgi:hypothetical protein